MNSQPTLNRMYRAVVEKDPAFEGVFFVAVKTTGIFCRPTCSARRPNRQNVEFFPSAREALHAGYRPCRRCMPIGNGVATPPWVRRLLNRVHEAGAARLTPSDLRDMHIVPATAARWFKTHHGMTFQGYQRALRMGAALGLLRQKHARARTRNGAAARTSLRTGFRSESGFRSAFNRMFNATPTQAHNVQPMFAHVLTTPLGSMLAIAGDHGLALLEFVDRRMLETQLAVLGRRFARPVLPGLNPHLASMASELDGYFAGKLRKFTTPIALEGTPFQVKVWKRLMRIPYGQTCSYAEMARDIGVKDAQRAVGKANGDNRLAIIIPCHRVIRSDGSLCGYGGGVWRKKRLLELEKHAATNAAEPAIVRKIRKGLLH